MSSKRKNKVLIDLYIPVEIVEEIDRLVQKGKYMSRSEFIRTAIVRLLESEKIRDAINI